MGALPAGAAAGFYRAILDDIEAHDYDVFPLGSHRRLGKLRRLPGIWWRAEWPLPGSLNGSIGLTLVS
jgi:phytoene synthase